MAQLLDAATLAVIKDAIKDVVDTFAKVDVIINHRQVTNDMYGEKPEVTVQPFPFLAMIQYTVASGGRYITVDRTGKGQEMHDGWRVYLWKDEVDASGLVVNGEADKVEVNGKEYEIRFFSPSAFFSDLGPLFYEFDIYFN